MNAQRNNDNYPRLKGDYIFERKNEIREVFDFTPETKQFIENTDKEKLTAYEQLVFVNELAKRMLGFTTNQKDGAIQNMPYFLGSGQSYEFSVLFDAFGKNSLEGISYLMLYCKNNDIPMKILNPAENKGIFIKMKMFSEKDLHNLYETSKDFLSSEANYSNANIEMLRLNTTEGVKTRTFIKCLYAPNNPYFSFFIKRANEKMEEVLEEGYEPEDLILLDELINDTENSFVERMDRVIQNSESKEEVFELFLSYMLSSKEKYGESLMLLYLPIIFRFMKEWHIDF